MKKKLKYIIAVFLLILFTFSVVPKTFQNDTYYIIELGRQIEQNGIDWKDHYSIHENLEYRYPHWAFDVLNYKVFDLFGFDGTYFLTVTFAVILILIVFATLLKKDVNFVLAFTGSLVTAYLMSGAFYARGQIVSFSLFLIEYLILERFVERPTLLKTLGLFAVSCLMANFHSTAWVMMLVLPLPFIGEQVFYYYSLTGICERKIKKLTKKLETAKEKGLSQEEIEKIEKDLKERKEFIEVSEKEAKNKKIIVKPNKNIKYIIIAIIALIAGALVTPLKLTPFLYYLKISTGNTMSYINEHLPIVVASNKEFLIYAILVIALIGFTDVKLKLSDAFLILGLTILALTSRRSVYLLIILTACIIIKLIDIFIKSHKNEEIDEKTREKINNRIFIFFVIVAIFATIYMVLSQINNKYINEKLYPVKAVEYIKENLDYENIRFYNGYDYGSYLLMNGIPVFIDSRCDLYTPEFNKDMKVFDDYMDVQSGKTTISKLMDKYDLEYAIIPTESFEHTYMKEDSRYTETYKDKNFAVYKYDAR